MNNSLTDPIREVLHRFQSMLEGFPVESDSREKLEAAKDALFKLEFYSMIAENIGKIQR